MVISAFYIGLEVTIYLDNEEVGYLNLQLATTSSPFFIGRRYNQENQYMDGKVDDVRIYNRALNEQEVNELFYENKCFETVYDTIEVIDTTFVTIYDTIYVAVTDTLVIDVTISEINPPDNIDRIKVYPNPARDVIYIHTGKYYEQMTDYKIKIINSTGTAIFESNVTEQLFEINVQEFGQTGLYFIQIIDSTNQIIDIRKIILE